MNASSGTVRQTFMVRRLSNAEYDYTILLHQKDPGVLVVIVSDPIISKAKFFTVAPQPGYGRRVSRDTWRYLRLERMFAGSRRA